MSATYKMLAEFAQTWGLALLRRGVRRRARLCALAFAQGASSTKPHACRCARIDRHGGATTRADRRRHRHRHDRPRMGRHPRAEHAAAALVAVDVLRHHRLVGRLLDRLSVLAADLVATPRACFGWQSRDAVVSGSREPAGAARRRWPPSSPHARSQQIEKDPAAARFRARPGRAAFSENCAPCHGAGGGGAKGYPEPQRRRLAVGRHARGDRARPSATASRCRSTTRPGSAPCRPSAATACSSAPRSTTVADYVRSLAGLPVEPGADLAAGARSSPTTAPPATARAARAIASMGAPNLTDAIWLYGSDKAAIVETV